MLRNNESESVTEMHGRGWMVVVAGVAITTATLAAPGQAVSPGSVPDSLGVVAAVSAQSASSQFRKVRRTRVFFGHQSVGWNIIDGMNALYSARGMTAPNLFEGSTGLPSGGVFAQEGIGSNGDPNSKIGDFAAKIRAGAGSRVRVAFMKLCFVDFSPSTNAGAVFTRYRRTLRSLSRQYPRVAFLHVTAPLTTNDPASNVVRERYNSLLRQTYGRTGRLFDLAKIESTRPDGRRVSGRRGGARYYALYGGYASDDGHLNARGSARAARAMLQAIAAAA